METPVAKKLDSLMKLQEIDSKLHELAKIRGDLPDEVQDLEDEIEGYETRIGKFRKELEEMETFISNNRHQIQDAKRLIAKYEEQQMNVRNNREYDAISKEMELQELEIKLCEKRIRETEFKIGNKKEQIVDVETVKADRSKDLASKKGELDVIISETKKEEEALLAEREARSKTVEPRLYKSYVRIRDNARNHLAVVIVARNACGGCFNVVPPQRQADIRDKKKLIVCEHCGRIFADVEVVIEPEKPVKRGRRKAAK